MQTKQRTSLQEALEYIHYKYVDGVNLDSLQGGAIQEMMSHLDPHSVYFPPAELKTANEELSGNFEGIGVEFNVFSDTVNIVYVVPNGPSDIAGLKIGDKIRPSIDESIRLHDKLLLVLSEHSVASQWVEQEVEAAFEKERQENCTVLFPIRLDDVVMEIKDGWPALIRNTRNIGDFTRWMDHDAYRKGLERLLHDLKAET